jgi:hypothetical protein
MNDWSTEFEMFSEARIALCREIVKCWPVLAQQLHEVHQENPDITWPDQLGIIAAFCGVVMDGFYSQQQLEELTDKLYWKLHYARKGIIAGVQIGIPLENIPPETKPTKH